MLVFSTRPLGVKCKLYKPVKASINNVSTSSILIQLHCSISKNSVSLLNNDANYELI